jgi:putative hydrolase of the HAD superfamily
MPTRPTSIEQGDALPNISAVILDYGQVLAYSATLDDFRRMAEIFNVSAETFFTLWEDTRGPYDRGDLTAEEYWLKLAAQANTSIDQKQIETLRKIEIESWIRLDQGMLEWVSRLRAAGIKTGLLSNMPWDLIEYLRANCEWLNDFFFKTFSAEVRVIKPDAAIYEHTLHGLGVSASEALFIDDREINIQAAHALGIHAIQFRSSAQLKSDLEALRFPVLPENAETPAETSGAVKVQL